MSHVIEWVGRGILWLSVVISAWILGGAFFDAIWWLGAFCERRRRIEVARLRLAKKIIAHGDVPGGRP